MQGIFKPFSCFGHVHRQKKNPPWVMSKWLVNKNGHLSDSEYWYNKQKASDTINPFHADLPYTLITLSQAALTMLAGLAHIADKLSHITKTSISQKLLGQFYSFILHCVQNWISDLLDWTLSLALFMSCWDRAKAVEGIGWIRSTGRGSKLLPLSNKASFSSKSTSSGL